MLFGFAAAVLAGFLLTAVGNWTGRETAAGAPLLALAGLWVAGRAAMMLADALPRAVVAAVDISFLPALLGVVLRPLVAARNRRNFVMIGILAALTAANVVVHLEALGVVPAGTARRACLAATDVVVFAILLVAGRVFPMFTRNATGIESVRNCPPLDAFTLAAMAALVVLDAALPERRVTAAAAGAVGILAVLRAARWGTRHAAQKPLLWILHAGYAWLAAGLLLRAAAGLGAPVPESLATHALTWGPSDRSRSG
jgi:uncharacterized protein involved in response to NO